MDESRMSFLQNVLRYSASHSDGTTSDNQPREMSPERKKWLENALDNMTVNPIDEIKKCIKCLSDPSEADKHVTALETLRDWCEDINFAIDFHKINQYELLFTLLKHEKAQIRALTFDLIGTLAQNNTYCQETLLASKIMPLVLQALDKDVDEVKIKALFAISCLCRDYEPCQEKLMEGNAIDILMKALKSPVEKLQLKCCFLFSSLCSANKHFKSMVTEKRLIETLIDFYRHSDQSNHEHVLSCINVLVEENPDAVAQALEMKHIDFKKTLIDRMNAISDDPSHNEERDIIKSILEKFFRN